MEEMIFLIIKDNVEYSRGYSESVVKLENQLKESYNCKSAVKLENQLKESYNCKFAIIANSGLTAISTVYKGTYLKYCKDHVNLIYSNELYTETQDVILSFKQYYFKDANTESFEITESESLLTTFFDKYFGQINILFFESSSNPHSYVFLTLILSRDYANYLRYCM
uniref:Uncharacterized protein n=1 Tax=viral metagenome TaxID=1070528 RepID=A0A6C0C7W6_9ZZZZ